MAPLERALRPRQLHSELLLRSGFSVNCAFSFCWLEKIIVLDFHPNANYLTDKMSSKMLSSCE